MAQAQKKIQDIFCIIKLFVPLLLSLVLKSLKSYDQIFNAIGSINFLCLIGGVLTDFV